MQFGTEQEAHDFLRAHPQFSTPQSLVDAPLIHEINLDRWAKWFLACGIPVSKPLSGPRIGQAHLVVEAARQGYGVALSNAIIGATDLQEGELCEIGATDVYLGSYMMTVTRAAQNRRATMQFQKWLLSCAGGFAPAQGRVPS